MSLIRSVNPATGELLAELPVTQPDEIRKAFERARAAQKRWAELSVSKRVAHLIQLRETILNRADEIVELISKENGKPRFEALSSEVFPSLELITFYAKAAPARLRDEKLSLRLMPHRRSVLERWPLGVIAVISPWNYPFFLPMGEIVMGLVTGNAILFKPSEVTPLVGLKIQELLDEAGIPSGVFQTLTGDGSVGAELIRQKPDKIFFTGSVKTGKRIMAQAAEHLTPVCLELGGKDAMIVLPDADLDFASSAALWGGCTNGGQACASVERLIVHQSVADEFQDRLAKKLATLRQAPSTGPITNDLGPTTFDNQKAVYAAHLEDARKRGLEILAGGEFSPDRRFLKPTLVRGGSIEQADVYTEETFGPVMAMTTFRSIDEAVEKANQSRYGLLASVMTRDLSLGERVARRLEVGTVTVNEVLYTAGLPETPWGGVKESGFGRKHSAEFLLEFVNTRHIHRPKASFLTFKAFWWFPYTEHQYGLFRTFLGIYHKNWLRKLKAIPETLWHLVKFLKLEKRI